MQAVRAWLCLGLLVIMCGPIGTCAQLLERPAGPVVLDPADLDTIQPAGIQDVGSIDAAQVLTTQHASRTLLAVSSDPQAHPEGVSMQHGSAAETAAPHGDLPLPAPIPAHTATPERHKRGPAVLPSPEEFERGQGAGATAGPGSTLVGTHVNGRAGETLRSDLHGPLDPVVEPDVLRTSTAAPPLEHQEAEEEDPGRRINLASAADGATVVAANKEARNPGKTVDGDDDSYMKNSCTAQKWIVLELSQLGRVDEVSILNKEMYSSRVRDWSIKGRQSHPRKDGPLLDLPRWFDTDSWQLLGNFTAVNRKGEQSFVLPKPHRVRYLLLQFHTHYGTEEICALNSITVSGVSAAQELEEALSRHLTPSLPPTPPPTPNPSHPSAGAPVPPEAIAHTPPPTPPPTPTPAHTGVGAPVPPEAAAHPPPPSQHSVGVPSAPEVAASTLHTPGLVLPANAASNLHTQGHAGVGGVHVETTSPALHQDTGGAVATAYPASEVGDHTVPAPGLSVQPQGPSKPGQPRQPPGQPLGQPQGQHLGPHLGQPPAQPGQPPVQSPGQPPVQPQGQPVDLPLALEPTPKQPCACSCPPFLQLVRPNTTQSCDTPTRDAVQGVCAQALAHTSSGSSAAGAFWPSCGSAATLGAGQLHGCKPLSGVKQILPNTSTSAPGCRLSGTGDHCELPGAFCCSKTGPAVEDACLPSDGASPSGTGCTCVIPPGTGVAGGGADVVRVAEQTGAAAVEPLLDHHLDTALAAPGGHPALPPALTTGTVDVAIPPQPSLIPAPAYSGNGGTVLQETQGAAPTTHPAPAHATTQSAVTQSAVTQSAVTQSAVTQSAVAQSAVTACTSGDPSGLGAVSPECVTQPQLDRERVTPRPAISLNAGNNDPAVNASTEAAVSGLGLESLNMPIRDVGAAGTSPPISAAIPLGPSPPITPPAGEGSEEAAAQFPPPPPLPPPPSLLAPVGSGGALADLPPSEATTSGGAVAGGSAVWDALLAAIEGGPAAKPKQAGNLFDLFKQEMVLLRMNQSRVWKYINQLVEQLNKNAADAAAEVDTVEMRVDVLEAGMRTSAAAQGGELTTLQHKVMQSELQVMELAQQVAGLREQLQQSRTEKWAMLLYTSIFLALGVAFVAHSTSSRSTEAQDSRRPRSASSSVGGAAHLSATHLSAAQLCSEHSFTHAPHAVHRKPRSWLHFILVLGLVLTVGIGAALQSSLVWEMLVSGVGWLQSAAAARMPGLDVSSFHFEDA